MSVTFEILGPPMGKQRHRTPKKGKPYTPKETKEYEELVRLCYLATGKHAEILTTMVQVDIEAFYLIPKSFSKPKRAQALCGNLRPIVKPDLDNIMKIVCDALNGFVYKDDSQIVSAHVDKWYWSEPKVRVTVTDLG